MPRPNRLLPGQQEYHSSGKLDVGKILLSIFGGVEANPEFLQEKPRPDDAMQGPMPAKSQDFFRPKTIFDRSRAAEANAQFKLDELNAQRDRDAELDMLRQKNAMELSNFGARNAAELERLRKQNVLDFVRSLGIPLADDSVVKEIQARTEDQIKSALEASALAKQREAEANRTKASLGMDIAQGTAGSALRQALAESEFGATQAEANVPFAERYAKQRYATEDAKRRLLENQGLSEGLLRLAPGTVAFDPNAGREVYRAPEQNKWQGTMDILNNISGKAKVSPIPSANSLQNNTSVPSPTIQPRQLRPDEEVVEINGSRYIIRK